MIIKNNKLYDFLKWLGRYCLPALAVFVPTFCKIWNIPFGAEIGASISAIIVLLNTMLGIASENYQKDNYEDTNEL